MKKLLHFGGCVVEIEISRFEIHGDGLFLLDFQHNGLLVVLFFVNDVVEFLLDLAEERGLLLGFDLFLNPVFHQLPELLIFGRDCLNFHGEDLSFLCIPKLESDDTVCKQIENVECVFAGLPEVFAEPVKQLDLEEQL